VNTWAKRGIGIGIVAAALAAGSELGAWFAPRKDPPASVDAWHLASPAECGKAVPLETREWRGVAGARRVCRADYTGPAPMRVTLFDLPGYPAGPGAFDAWQKWPPNQPGKIGFWSDRYFAVAESPGADRAALDRFAISFTRAFNHAEPSGRW
jgi:hypothetical protein